MNKLSQDAESLKSAILQAKLNLKTASDAFYELKRNCICEFKPLTQKQLDDEWISETARCLICGECHGWRCKESPDGVCHYRSKDGKVELLGNRKCDIPPTHDPSNESDEWCIFCDMPEERK